MPKGWAEGGRLAPPSPCPHPHSALQCGVHLFQVSGSLKEKYYLGDVRKRGNVTRENPSPSSQWWKGPFPGPAQYLGLLRAPPTMLRPAPLQGTSLLLLCPPACLCFRPAVQMIEEAVSPLVPSSFSSGYLFAPLPCAGSGLSATGETRQRERGSGRDSRLLPGGCGQGQEGLLHLRVITGVLYAT